MNKLPWILVVVLSVALLVSALDFRPLATASTTRYLYVQTAGAGEMTPVEGEHGTFELTLSSVDPEVIYFADRPGRDTGSMSADDPSELVFDPSEPLPNAVLVVSHTADTDEQVSVPIQLSDAQYDQISGTMSYRAFLLEEFPENVPHTDGEPVEEVPASFTEASLFIDSDSKYGCSVTFDAGTMIDEVDGEILRSDVNLYVESKSPSTEWHWPRLTTTTITNESTTVTYKWKSRSKLQKARVTYEAWRDNLEKGYGNYEATVELAMNCVWKFGRGGVLKDAWCTVSGDDADQFVCRKEGSTVYVDAQ